MSCRTEAREAVRTAVVVARIETITAAAVETEAATTAVAMAVTGPAENPSSECLSQFSVGSDVIFTKPLSY